MNVHLLINQPKDMRPEVDGADWYFDEKGDLIVKVCPMSSWKHEMLLATHEMVEALMCRSNGVTVKQVDEFDKRYDLEHPNETDVEAGDDPAAPYEREHCFATAIERVLCAEFGTKWRHYDDELKALYPGPSHKKT